MNQSLNRIMPDGWVRVGDLMPKPNVVVEVEGSDSLGEWVSFAKWVPYKGKQPKNNRKHGRWLYPAGGRLGSYGDVDRWRAKK